MGPEAWLTLSVVGVMIYMLITSRFGADFMVLGALAMLLVCSAVLPVVLPGVFDPFLEPAEAINGFANPVVMTIAMLYVLAAGLKETGAIAIISQKVLGQPKSELMARLRLALPVAVLSAFANNTPIVATFMPVVHTVSKRTGIPVARLLLPLSYAAILGGLCTLIGTSTTLLVYGLYNDKQEEFPALAMDDFGMFTMTAVGVPIAVVGVAYIVFAGRFLLPKKCDDIAAPERLREYTTALRVKADSPVVGKTIEEAGLRHLPNLFLSRIERKGQTIVAVGPAQMIHANDVLVFVGVLSSVVDLQSIKGLVPVGVDAEQQVKYRPSLKLIEAVLSATSPLVNQTIRDAGIRARYDAVVVAVHRHGHRIEGKIGDIRLQPSDTILLEAGSDFAETHKDSADFFLVNAHGDAATPRHERSWIALGILVLFVLLISVGVPGVLDPVEPMIAAMVAAGGMVVLRCCTGGQARRSVDLQVIAVIAGAFGIGAAMENTQLAQVIANAVVSLGEPLGEVGLLALIYVLTLAFTTVITNNAAAVLMFPIAMSAAQAAELPLLGTAVTVAVAASAEFSTPIGYQTNLMVMGPGGYKWSDYLRFGGPLTLLCSVLCITLVTVLF